MGYIFVLGFMGAGKTTFGKNLATFLHLPFYDLDHVIEKQTQLSIIDIFKQKGETYFRKIESDVLINWNSPGVISTGGGVLSNEKNRTYLKNLDSLKIYLHTDFSILYDRICKSNRPLVKQLSRDELFQLWQQRISWYQECCNLTIFNYSV